MIRRKFVVEQHEEFGTLGYRPAWMPHADPLSGLAVAHDTFEHFPGDDGGVPAELQALGASLFVRGEGGYWHQHSRMVEPSMHLAADFEELFRHVAHEGFPCPCPPGRRGTRKLEEHVEGWIADTRKQALMHAEHFDDGERCAFRTWMRVCEYDRWLRIGYRRARMRYKGRSEYELAHAFHEVEKRADKLLSEAMEGQELSVIITPTLYPLLRLDFPEEGY